MKQIEHQWLTVHDYSTIVLPTAHVPADRSFELVQRDKSTIKVERNPGAFWSCTPNEMPETMIMHFFGMAAKHVLMRLRQKYPDFAALPINDQTFHIIGVKKL